MMNIIQYSLMAVVPIVFLNKSIQKFVPDIDEEKGSLEVKGQTVISKIQEPYKEGFCYEKEL